MRGLPGIISLERHIAMNLENCHKLEHSSETVKAAGFVNCAVNIEVRRDNTYAR